MPREFSGEPGDPVRLGEYRVTGRLGEGGQGIVYRAEGPGGEQVAVKLLHARLAGDPDARRRFVREAAAAERVARFCTARVLHADVAGDRPYIVSEYVEGASLHELVTTQGPRTDGALERLAIGTATALVAIHRAGVVHRDFKPQNVLMGPDGPRVIDFGIAKALDAMSSQTSQIVGTPAYMAPEQVKGEPPTPATDVFAWAATMVFAATGAAPFGHDSVPAVLHRLLNEEPRADGVPGELAGLLHDCLAKDPAHRPTARDVLARLLDHDAGDRGAAGESDLLTEGSGLAGGAATVHDASHTAGALRAGGDAETLVVPPVSETAPAMAPTGRGRGPSGKVPLLALLAVLAVVVAALSGALLTLLWPGGRSGESPPAPRAGGTRVLSGSTAGASAPSAGATRGTAVATPGDTGNASGFPAEYAGTWTGVITQDDGHTWPVRLTIVAAARVAQVTYPRPGCSGVQTLLSRTGDRLDLREDITEGRDSCTDSGTVTLRLNPGGTLGFTYSAARDTGAGSYSATARLTRS